MVQRGLQYLTIEMQCGVGIVEQFERRLGGDGALAQHQRHHQTRGGRPDRRRDQVLSMLQQFEISRRRRVETGVVAGRESFERMTGAIGAEILRHRALNILHRHRGAPAPERRRRRRERIGHKQVRLQPFDRGRLARERQPDIGQQVKRERPENAVQQRRQVGAEQGLRTQCLDAEWTVLQQQQAGGIAVQKARKKQRIAPHRDADQHARHGAPRGRAPPQHAEKCRRKLRDGRERQQADRRQLGVAQRAIVKIGHRHDGENRETANPEQEVAKVPLAGARLRRALQHQRHHDVVRDHDRKRDAFHDHHGGCRRKAADEDADAEQRGIPLDWQRQHIHVAVDRAERKGHEAGDCDRNHEQVDGDQIQRKQPARPAHLGGAGILHHADVKLARQQHDRAKRQQHHGQEIADRWRVVDGAHRFRRLHRALDQFERAEQEERDAYAGGEKGHQFHDGFGGDRQHQAMLVLGRVGLAGSEQHRERRHRQRHDQRHIADDRNRGDGLVFV